MQKAFAALAITFGLIGLAVGLQALTQLARAASRKRKPLVDAKITACELRDDGTGTYFFPIVHYRFTVDGRTFEGVRRLTDDSVAAAFAEEHLAPYSVGAALPVRYDRARPERNAADEEIASPAKTLAIGAGLVGAAAILALLAFVTTR